MSYSLKIVDGDLSPKGSTLEVVFGKEKLLQDIDLWLRERFGGDRFHPMMGSTLQEYVGGVNSPSIVTDIQDEVLRVLSNYQQCQRRILTRDPSSLSLSELLVSVDQVEAWSHYDSIHVRIRITNGVNETQTIIAGAAA